MKIIAFHLKWNLFTGLAAQQLAKGLMTVVRKQHRCEGRASQHFNGNAATTQRVSWAHKTPGYLRLQEPDL
ncbi:hypothetical protein D9M68_944250 [compost metagenome]